jgi:hypothetical protein
MGLVPGTSCEGVQMKFVDELPDPEHEVEANQCENTSLGFRSTRTGPSKSTTRLRAFVKQKSVEDMVAEDEERRKRQEEFTSNALQDIEQQGH